MKKLMFALCVFAVMATCSSLTAQHFKKLRLGIGLGAGVAQQNYDNLTTKKVMVGSLEPSYRINDKINVGIRLETIGQPFGSTLTISSYGLNSQYYFSNTIFRPFVGLGVGLYHHSINGSALYGYSSRLEHTTLGACPRLGLDWKHLSLFVDINLVRPAKALIYPPWPEPMFQGKLNSNYISAKVVVYIGGGQKSVK